MSLNIGCITQNINFDDDDDDDDDDDEEKEEEEDTHIRFRAILFSNTRIRMKIRRQAQRDRPGVQGEATDIYLGDSLGLWMFMGEIPRYYRIVFMGL